MLPGEFLRFDYHWERLKLPDSTRQMHLTALLWCDYNEDRCNEMKFFIHCTQSIFAGSFRNFFISITPLKSHTAEIHAEDNYIFIITRIHIVTDQTEKAYHFWHRITKRKINYNSGVLLPFVFEIHIKRTLISTQGLQLNSK
jgi:hypothetical protein